MEADEAPLKEREREVDRAAFKAVVSSVLVLATSEITCSTETLSGQKLLSAR